VTIGRRTVFGHANHQKFAIFQNIGDQKVAEEFDFVALSPSK
jgi:hypothetical protein